MSHPMRWQSKELKGLAQRMAVSGWSVENEREFLHGFYE